MTVPILFVIGVVAGILISLVFLHYVPIFISTNESGVVTKDENIVLSNYSNSMANYVRSILYMVQFLWL